MEITPKYLIVTITSAVLLYLSVSTHITHRDDWINNLRRVVFPKLDDYLEEHDLFAVKQLNEKELAISSKFGYNHIEKVLETNLGFTRNIASSLKVTPDGVKARSSWALRESSYSFIPDYLALRQLHVTLVETDTGTDIYAHEEYSSINPLVAWYHIVGKTTSDERGVNQFKEIWKRHKSGAE